ncbi:MAG: agmatinase [Magnetococcales bacterium]|nr:agmatinase [Magnetococcales bacterium]
MKQRHPLIRSHFAGNQAPLAKADVVILPVPYEGTVSYGRGTAAAPAAILAASSQLEHFDEELLCRCNQVGIHTLPAMSVASSPKAMLRHVAKAALPPLSKGKFLLTLGGEHSISVGVFRACQEVHGDAFSILHLDAHTDLRHRYQGNRYSHACVMRHAYNMHIPFVQVGIRSVSHGEWKFIQKNQLQSRIHWANHIVTEQRRCCREWMEGVVASLADKVYVTLDVDCLDPACMPATGTPEPGGLDYYTLLQLLRLVGEKKEVIGADITELAPLSDQPAWSYSAARIAQKMVSYFIRPHQTYRFSGHTDGLCEENKTA